VQALRSRLLAQGDKLGKYELVRQIAIGGMAELYLARTVGMEGFEKLVVVKRILPQFASNSSFVAMFVNEARLAATLQHPNVAQVYDIGVDDGEFFFSMEYVHGENLDQIGLQAQQRATGIPLDATLTLIAGLCSGLHYAHERIGPDGTPLGIVHRDVSPSNVLVSYDGSVKLVDFGIARATSRTTSAHGGLKGKIVYMSPEQCRADTVLDRRSDLYSIGTLLYQLTTGRPPFTGETDYAVLNQIVNVDAPPPRGFLPTYPEALERIVLRALSRDPAQRFSSALELQSALEDFAHDNRLRVSPLVLAKLMGTLFPSRLAEWHAAKSQGAFFVEQHVVRTLIEKTPDPNDPAARAHIKAAQHALAAVTPAPEPTVPTPPPMTASQSGSRIPVPVGFAVPAGGTLVTSSTVARPIEITERVVVPRTPGPEVGQATMIIQVEAPKRSRRGLAVVGAALLACAAGAGVFVATRGGDQLAGATAVPAQPTETATAPAPVPAPTPPAAVAPPPAPTPAPATDSGSGSAAPVEVAEPPVAPKKVVAHPKPHPKPKPAKEQTWNADSPFMPVHSH
jgi:serine/threonine protein kinase